MIELTCELSPELVAELALELPTELTSLLPLEEMIDESSELIKEEER